MLESLASHARQEVGNALEGDLQREAVAGPRFYLLVGIPGSGKTTYARRYLAQALRLSFDDLRLMLTGVPFHPDYEAMVISVGHAALGSLLARARGWGRDVLLDATNTTRGRRRFYLGLAARHALPAVAVYFDCPLEVALARDAARERRVGEAVVRRFHAQSQPPTVAEGFAEVVTIADLTPWLAQPPACLLPRPDVFLPALAPIRLAGQSAARSLVRNTLANDRLFVLNGETEQLVAGGVSRFASLRGTLSAAGALHRPRRRQGRRRLPVLPP